MTRDENGENVPWLEITEVILVHSNIVNNNYQIIQSIIRYFTQEFYIFKTFDTEFSYIDVWFTDQNSSLQRQKTK